MTARPPAAAARDGPSLSATRIVASTLAGIVSAAGVMHGCFELLQGHVAPTSRVVNAIGPDQRLWEYAGLHAFTLLPDLFVTGLLAVTLGAVATIWAVACIGTKRGPLGMGLLSIGLFLVGGGFGPLVVGVTASYVATRIGKPPAWWRAHPTPATRRFLARLWPWTLLVYVLVFVVSVVVVVTGWPLTLVLAEAAVYAVALWAGYVLLALMLAAVASAFAFDIQTASNQSHQV